MKLFLCSHFSSVGSLIKEEIKNKKVAFIPTASLREGYTGHDLDDVHILHGNQLVEILRSVF